jgi:hypothetical protein
MPLGPYTSVMADENSVFEEAMDNLKEAGQRIRATQALMRAHGMTDGENYRDLLTASFSEHDPHGMVHTYGLHKVPD